MHRSNIKSSTLRAAGYNIDYKTLEIEFTSGEIYQYFNVPHSHYIGLMQAASHGEFFNRYIKDNFHYNKIP